MRQLPAEFSRITTGLVDGDLPLYSRAPGNLDTIGIQPQLWASARSFWRAWSSSSSGRQLAARSEPGGLFWAWIPATAPPIVRANIWGDDVPPSWGIPQVTPEQLRLMTYMALSAGYRGLGFLGDADLTRPAGRALLIELAFLNEEIDLLRVDPGQQLPTRSRFTSRLRPRPSGPAPAGNPAGDAGEATEGARAQARPARLRDRRRAQGCTSAAGRLCRQCSVSASANGRAQPGGPGAHARKRTGVRGQPRRGQAARPRTGPRWNPDRPRRIRHHGDDPVHDRPGTQGSGRGGHRPGSPSGSATGHRTGRADAPDGYRDQRPAERRRPAPDHSGSAETTGRRGDRGQAHRRARPAGQGRGVDQVRPGSPGARGLRAGLGRSPAGRPAAANPHVRSLAHRPYGTLTRRGERFLFQACRQAARPATQARPDPRAHQAGLLRSRVSRSTRCRSCTSGSTGSAANRATSSVPTASPAAASTTPRP